ncbi:hypothetical protein [Streptomyces sp. NBC_00448]
MAVHKPSGEVVIVKKLKPTTPGADPVSVEMRDRLPAGGMAE